MLDLANGKVAKLEAVASSADSSSAMTIKDLESKVASLTEEKEDAQAAIEDARKASESLSAAEQRIKDLLEENSRATTAISSLKKQLNLRKTLFGAGKSPKSKMHTSLSPTDGNGVQTAQSDATAAPLGPWSDKYSENSLKNIKGADFDDVEPSLTMAPSVPVLPSATMQRQDEPLAAKKKVARIAVDSNLSDASPGGLMHFFKKSSSLPTFESDNSDFMDSDSDTGSDSERPIGPETTSPQVSSRAAVGVVQPYESSASPTPSPTPPLPHFALSPPPAVGGYSGPMTPIHATPSGDERIDSVKKELLHERDLRIMREAQSCTLREEIETLQGTLEETQARVDVLQSELEETKCKRETVERHVSSLEETVASQRKKLDGSEQLKKDHALLTSDFAKLHYASAMKRKVSCTKGAIRTLISNTPWTVLLLAYIAQFVVTPDQRRSGPL